MRVLILVIAVLSVGLVGCAWNPNAYDLLEEGMTVDEVLVIMDGWLIADWHESSDGYLGIWFGDYSVKVTFWDGIATRISTFK